VKFVQVTFAGQARRRSAAAAPAAAARHALILDRGRDVATGHRRRHVLLALQVAVHHVVRDGDAAAVAERLQVAVDAVAVRQHRPALRVELQVAGDAREPYAGGRALLDLHRAAETRVAVHDHVGRTLGLQVAVDRHVGRIEHRARIDDDRTVQARAAQPARRVGGNDDRVDRRRADRQVVAGDVAADAGRRGTQRPAGRSRRAAARGDGIGITAAAAAGDEHARRRGDHAGSNRTHRHDDPLGGCTKAVRGALARDAGLSHRAGAGPENTQPPDRMHRAYSGASPGAPDRCRPKTSPRRNVPRAATRSSWPPAGAANAARGKCWCVAISA
jgi:hypothetical protein